MHIEHITSQLQGTAHRAPWGTFRSGRVLPEMEAPPEPAKWVPEFTDSAMRHTEHGELENPDDGNTQQLPYLLQTKP